MAYDLIALGMMSDTPAEQTQKLNYYFYGGLVGAVIIGPLYDFVLYGSAYMILDLLILLSVLWQILLVCIPGRKDTNEWSLFIYGMMY